MPLSKRSTLMSLLAAFATLLALPCTADVTHSGTIYHGRVLHADGSVVRGYGSVIRNGRNDQRHLRHPYQVSPRQGRYGYGGRGDDRHRGRGDQHHYDQNTDRFGHRPDRHSGSGRSHKDRSSRHYGGHRDNGYGYNPHGGSGYRNRYKPFTGSSFGYRYKPFAGSSSGYGKRYKPYAGSGYGSRYNSKSHSRRSSAYSYGRSYPSTPGPITRHRYRR